MMLEGGDGDDANTMTMTAFLNFCGCGGHWADMQETRTVYIHCPNTCTQVAVVVYPT